MNLLDTNVAIRLRAREPEAIARVAELSQVILSVITVVELEGGIDREPSNALFRRQRLDAMLRTVDVAPFDAHSAAAYGRIVAACGYSRRRVLDRMIAATALVIGAAVVTANPDDFSDVPDLRLVKW